MYKVMNKKDPTGFVTVKTQNKKLVLAQSLQP